MSGVYIGIKKTMSSQKKIEKNQNEWLLEKKWSQIRL
jgi:hypothetical protein